MSAWKSSYLDVEPLWQAKMRILVTGGAGFIGSHLVDRLMESGTNEVIVADNFFSGSKYNLKRWIGHPNFELIRHDVTETLLVEVDQIYHLACPASPIFYKYNPVKVCICCPFICVYMCRYVQNFKELYSLQLLSSPGSPPSFESKMSCCSSHSLLG
jgi:saccharopine dehydrogenase-like NADP-dependent oxidoreductase